MLRLLRKYVSGKLFNVDKRVLIFSTHPAFVELSRNCLMEIKNLIVESASTIDEMRTLSDQSEFDLVILDAEFPENSPVEEIVSIQEQHASTMFLVFPPDNRQNHPIVGQFRADAFLNQPFYLPDFLDMVEKLVYRTQIQEMKFNESESYSIGDEEKGKIMQQTLSDWVNPTKIGEQLSQAMIESQAQGAFILYDGNPIVYRGDLDESVISEITLHLLRDWDRDKKSDIVRFMRLSADDKDHLIYASNFQEYYLLVLIFEKTLPIMVARSHSTHVGYNLRQIIENEHGTKTTEEFVENDALMDTAEILTPIKSDEDIPSLEDENQLEVSKLIDHLTEIASTGPQDPTKIFQREYKTEENDIDQDVTLPEWLEDDRKDSNEGIDSSNVIEEDDQLKWVKAEGQEETEEIYPDIELDKDSTEEDTVFSKQEKSSDRINLARVGVQVNTVTFALMI